MTADTIATLSRAARLEAKAAHRVLFAADLEREGRQAGAVLAWTGAADLQAMARELRHQAGQHPDVIAAATARLATEPRLLARGTCERCGGARSGIGACTGYCHAPRHKRERRERTGEPTVFDVQYGLCNVCGRDVVRALRPSRTWGAWRHDPGAWPEPEPGEWPDELDRDHPPFPTHEHAMADHRDTVSSDWPDD